jgi:hypothetical protein
MDKAQIEQMIVDERRRYAREWRLRNKARIAEYNKRYWLKAAQKRIGGGGNVYTVAE